MTQYRRNRVSEIIDRAYDLIKVRLDDDSRAYGYPLVNGDVQVGDEVIVNTTAVDLSLGTGGWHFIVWNLSHSSVDTPRGGHIMKLRYSPLQCDVGVEEEKDDWSHEKSTLDNMPVIAAPLHSHIPAIVTYLKECMPQLRISVAISDGASLPLAMSDLVRTLKDKGLIDNTVTFGHSFGGDAEAINIYTALLSARHRQNADMTIVTMGPGIVGTNSQFGFTGIEVAHHLDSAHVLGGYTYGVLRASAADPRERHRGISHHSITTFSQATHQRHKLTYVSDHELSSTIEGQINNSGLDRKHEVSGHASVGIVDMMEAHDLHISSMGRSARDDELFFESAAITAARVIEDGVL